MIPSIDAVVSGRQVPVVLVVGLAAMGADQGRPPEIINVGDAIAIRLRAENTLAGFARMRPLRNAFESVSCNRKTVIEGDGFFVVIAGWL